MQYNNIIIVLGRLCSGKGTFCKNYTDMGYMHIATSDVVKMVSGMSSREQLQNTGNLDQKIADKIIEIINNHKYVIIDGIRQCSIIERIVSHFHGVQLIWLEVDAATRKQWFEQRGDSKDNISFEQAELGDDKLGLAKVQSKYMSQCKIIKQQATFYE